MHAKLTAADAADRFFEYHYQYTRIHFWEYAVLEFRKSDMHSTVVIWRCHPRSCSISHTEKKMEAFQRKNSQNEKKEKNSYKHMYTYEAWII